MVDTRAVAAGRAARGIVATAALVTVALAALMALTWSCCSTPTFGERFGGILGVVPPALVAAVALPPVTRRVRASALRWWLLPLVVADFAVCGWLLWDGVRQMGDEPAIAKAVLYTIVPLVTPNVICAIYVAWRVVLFPPSVSPPERGT